MTGKKRDVQGDMIDMIDIIDFIDNTDRDVKWLFVPFFMFSRKK